MRKTSSFSVFCARFVNQVTILVVLLLTSVACFLETVDPDSDEGIRPDSSLTITKYFLPPGKTEEFPAGFEIIAREGMEINGDIYCDGDFTLTADAGDIVLGGKIMFKDSVSANTSGRIRKSGKVASRTDIARVANGFSRTVNALNGNITL